MLKKAKLWLLGLLTVALTVPACGGASFKFKDLELNQIDAIYDKDEDSEAVSIYFTSTEDANAVPAAGAYIYLFPSDKELKADTSYSLLYDDEVNGNFFILDYKESKDKETVYASTKGSFEVTSIDREKKVIKGLLKGVEIKAMDKGEFVGDAIAIPELDIDANMMNKDEFKKAHPTLVED